MTAIQSINSFSYQDKFNDGILNPNGWTYIERGTGQVSSDVTEHNGYLDIQNSQTDNGGIATLTFASDVVNAHISMDRLYHAENEYFFGHTNLNFHGADGEEIVVQLAMLSSQYGPDYSNDAANYNHPRLTIYDSAGFDLYFDHNLSTTSLFDEWMTTDISINNKTGQVSIDINGDGVADFEVTDTRLIGASLQSMQFDSYGWWEGHYSFMDNLTVNGLTETLGTPTAAEIFAAEGKLAFLSQLALSAYHLGGWEKNITLVNERNTYADFAFAGGSLIDGNEFTPVANNLQLLTPTELKGLRLIDNPFLGSTDADGIDGGLDGIADDFPKVGLKDGIYTNENAAALVGRSEDAIFLSFRGTNDNATGGGFFGTKTPDKQHWAGLDGMDDHYALFQNLITALKSYVIRVNGDSDLTNNVTTLYVTGHSLGAAMVQAFMEDWTAGELTSQWAGISAKAVTFASPGYGTGDSVYDGRISNFWNDRDPILWASFFQNNDGHSNSILHNLKKDFNLSDGASIHYMALYSGFTQFFWKSGIDLDDLNSADNPGQHFSSIHANVRVVNEGQQLFRIGVDADVLDGSRNENLMLGGGKDDVISAFGGADRLLGGADWDKLYGGTGSDTLEGGFGYDEMSGGGGKDYFVFRNLKETNSQSTNDTIDQIMDFGAGLFTGDVIDLSGIDARWNRPGDQIFGFIGAATFSGQSGELRFTQGVGQTLVMGDCNGDGVADFSIRLDGLHTLQERHFIL